MVNSLLNPIRSRSGIAIVTVMTQPYRCPGRCVYCPTEAGVPKSYLLNEPPVMRALQNDYDPYGQVTERLQALTSTGHATDKIELLIKGGTWSVYPQAYQQEFVGKVFEAANDFGSVTHPQACSTLLAAQQRNETAQHRIVGLTVETRPDHVTEQEVRRLRQLGVTRVELGVQSLDPEVLRLSVRDHGLQEVVWATRLLRDAGFKVNYHLMPNLPGATPEKDFQTFRTLWSNPDYRPDTLKIYPCVVVESAELSRWWKEGRWQPYDEGTLSDLLIRIKVEVPAYVRIERVVRDISAGQVLAGCRRNNLRQELARRMKAEGRTCSCIRCREVGFEAFGEFELVRREYEAAGGREIFLSFESQQRLVALLRLRIPTLDRTALVRELHTYGRHLPLEGGNGFVPQLRKGSVFQHRGFGKRLMREAERIAKEEFGLERLSVIAGVGVRAYYRKQGYELIDTYMVKLL